MFKRGLIKILADIKVNKTRSLIIFMSLILGITGFGVVFTSFSILDRELVDNYLKVEPASFQIETRGVSLRTLEALGKLPGVGKVEMRKELKGKMLLPGGKWMPLELKVIDNFESQKMNKVRKVSGNWPPGKGEILLEQDVFTFTAFKIGGSSSITTLKTSPKNFRITGKVHDPAEAPAHMEYTVYGYISAQSLSLIGENQKMTTLLVLVNGDTMDKALINRTAGEVRRFLAEEGVHIEGTFIPEPGKHPHFSQMASFLYILSMFGVFALILSTVLLMNMVSSIMTGQIKQIGILKAIGAGSWQISSLYFIFIGVFCLAGLLVGIPLSVLAGQSYSRVAAAELNFIIYNDTVPFEIYLLIFGIGLAVPLTAVSITITGTVSRSVMEALRFTEVKAEKNKRNLFDRLLEKIGSSSRVFMVSLKNTFRKKKRLLLTLLILSLGGAFFIAPYIIRSSLNRTIDKAVSDRNYQIEMVFKGSYNEDDVKNVLAEYDEISGIELVDFYSARTGRPGGGEINLAVIGIEAGDTALAFPVTRGRWLRDEAEASVVLNPMSANLFKDSRIGDTILLSIGEKQLTGIIRGVVNEVAAPPVFYMPKDFMAGEFKPDERRKGVYIQTNSLLAEDIDDLLIRLETDFPSRGMQIQFSASIYDRQKSMNEHLTIVMNFLQFISLFLIIIGALSIISSMGMNLMERKREIGILRSMGATPHGIVKIVFMEGIIIGLLSYLAALGIAPLLGYFSGNVMAGIFLKTKMIFTFSIEGAVIWLIITVLFTSIAGIWPAMKATRLPVSEAVSYE